MKHATKSYVLLALIVLMDVSCGPLAPVATVTATKLPILSVVPSITATPSLMRLLPSDGPDQEISSYRLRTWTEEDYTQIVGSLDDLSKNDESQIPYLIVPDYLVAFQQEHLLRFPDSSARDDILWGVLFNKPGTVAIPGIQTINDLMNSLISGLLAQGVQPAGLMSELEKHDLQIMDSFTVQNIIGNGEDGLVLLIKMYGVDTPLVGVFVIVSDGERFHVQKIRDWEVSEGFALYRDFEIYDVGDTNDNGLPEVVVQTRAGGGGIAKENVDHIEWSLQNGIFQSKSFPVFWQTCDGPVAGSCEGNWEFSKFDSQSLLTTRSYWPTRNDCPDLTTQSVFQWNGTQYVPKNSEVVSPSDDLPAECRLAWAETAIWISSWSGDIPEYGWENDLAISIVQNVLSNWPAGADEIWGPASRDYFKLKLAIWYELRGEAGKAKNLLRQLAARPYQVDFDFISRLASVYLERRESFSRVAACLDLQNMYFEEFRTAIPEPSPNNNDQAMLAAWGIVDDKESLCNTYDLLPVDVKDARLTSPELLMQWLDKIELTVYQKEDVDLNEDGLEDHLILLDMTNSEEPDVWTFLATPNGYQAAYLSDSWFENDVSKLTIQPIKLGGNMPAHLMLFDGSLVIFRVESDLTIKTLAETYDVQSFDIVDQVLPAKILVNIDNYYEGQRIIVYLWDSRTESFVEQPDNFINAQAEIEELLYAKESYQGTIDYIDKFLRAAPPEPKQAYVCSADTGCKYLPEWYVPYFRYLRGLAYEQLGQDEQARQAYFELWQDFPENVFGMTASLKLEPVNP